jgi:predicted secreted protein
MLDNRKKSLLSFEFLLAILLTGILVLSLAAICLNRKAPRWDGVYYFAILRSVYFDQDIDFNNEAEYFIWMQRFIRNRLPNQMISNPFALGSALLWSPFYAAADLVCSQQPGCVRNGYHHLYVAATLVGTVFWVCMGCILNAVTYYRLARRTRAGLAILTVASLALSSGLVFYALFLGDYSHGNSYFAASLLLFMTIWLMEREALSARHYLLLGLTIGLVFLVRWQDILFGILPVGMLIQRHVEQRTVSFTRAAGAVLQKGGLFIGLGVLIAALPQLVFWKILYGRLITLPQTSYAPGFLSGQYLTPGHILEYFFSTWNGAFLWHPILLVGMTGLLIYPKRFFPGWGKPSQALRVLLLAVTGLSYVAGLVVIDWWSGGAFGQRRLVSIYPFLGVGLLHLYHLAGSWRAWGRWALAGLVVVLIAWNILTLWRYQQGLLPFNPADPRWYESRQVYGHFEYDRRFTDILLGRPP